MANRDHFDRLTRGVEQWNQWRSQSPQSRPDLEGADVTAVTDDLTGVDFNRTNLRRAKLNGVSLADAILYDASLEHAELVDASVCGADLRGADFTAATVDGIRYDRKMRCLGASVDHCNGSQRFKRAVTEADYIESFTFEHQALSRFWRLTSDYSRSPARVGLIGLLIILSFSSLYYVSPSLLHWSGPVPHETPLSHWWFSPIYYSVVTFTTLGYGDVRPASTLGEILATCEVLVGYVWLGYLVSVLAHRASART